VKLTGQSSVQVRSLILLLTLDLDVLSPSV